MSTKYILPQKIEEYLRLLAQRLQAKHQDDYIKIILSEYKVIEAVYIGNDWEQTVTHEIIFYLEENLFLKTIDSKDKICHAIATEINLLHTVKDECYCITLDSKIDTQTNWREGYESLLPIQKKQMVLDSASVKIWGINYIQKIKVFISHRDTKKTFAQQIKTSLEPLGISCFVAHVDIDVNEEWLRTIDNAMRTSDLCLPLLTEDFYESNWTNQEIGFAYGFGIPIISIKTPKDPLGFISTRQGFPWKKNESFPTIEFIDVIFSSSYIPEVLKDKFKNTFISIIGSSGDFKVCNLIAETFHSWKDVSDKQINAIVSAYNDNRCARESFKLSGIDCYHRSRYSPNTLINWLNIWRPEKFMKHKDLIIQRTEKDV